MSLQQFRFFEVQQAPPAPQRSLLRCKELKERDEKIFSLEKEQFFLNNKLASLEKTAIVTALPVNIGGKKGFHYRYVDLLEKPELINFLELLESGAITIDHLISIKVGQKAAREQGPLFKVRANAREDLYKNIKRIDLMDL